MLLGAWVPGFSFNLEASARGRQPMSTRQGGHRPSQVTHGSHG